MSRYTDKQLSDAFDRVRDSKNWKNPIKADIIVVDEADRALITEAVIHYTGSVPTFTRKGNDAFTRVKAAGYYLTIGS